VDKLYLLKMSPLITQQTWHFYRLPKARTLLKVRTSVEILQPHQTKPLSRKLRQRFVGSDVKDEKLPIVG
jgi:hypothetical protein